MSLGRDGPRLRGLWVKVVFFVQVCESQTSFRFHRSPQPKIYFKEEVLRFMDTGVLKKNLNKLFYKPYFLVFYVDPCFVFEVAKNGFNYNKILVYQLNTTIAMCINAVR